MKEKQPAKSCPELKGFLLGDLDDVGLREFEAHLDECAPCRAAVLSWREDDEDLRMLDDALVVPEVSPFVAKRLVQISDEDLPPARESRLRLPLAIVAASALAAAAAVALVLVITDDPVEGEVTPPRAITPRLVYTDGGEVVLGRDLAEARLTVADEGRLLAEVDDDRIALSARSDARLARAPDGGLAIDLVRGLVTIDAAKRTGNDTLAVTAGQHRVVVVGTRFSVARLDDGGVKVAVSEGAVRVVSEVGEGHTVKHGQVFEFAAGEERLGDLESELARLMDELLEVPADGGSEDTEEVEVAVAEPEPEEQPADTAAARPSAPEIHSAAPPRPSMDDILDWILAGELARAETALGAHLRKHPKDVTAWKLLATSRRKAGKYDGAVVGFRKVIEYGNAQQSNRARFQAAMVLQDRLGRHREAAGLLEAYLQRPPALRPLEAEAMFRLADALLRQGSKQRAYTMLEQIRERFPGSSTALKAKRLLEQRSEG
jgi:TolA-binding protein